MEDALYITDSDGDLNVFNVRQNDSGLWLNTNYGNPDNFWNGNNYFVFVRLRKSLCFAHLQGGFYFKDLIHPPSILPTSSNFSERDIYLGSRLDNCHDIMEK